jgi:hypothetical protein
VVSRRTVQGACDLYHPLTRHTAPVFAPSSQVEGNELYAKGKYVSAMNKYSEAVAIFRYWNREMIGKEQNLVCYKDDEKCEGGDKLTAQKFIVSALLNAAVGL